MQLKDLLQNISDFIWGPPLLILLVGTGVYLTLRLRLLQIFKLPLALKYVFGKEDVYKRQLDSYPEALFFFCSPL